MLPARLANGAMRAEHYDFAGRLRAQHEPDGTALRYRYDSAGRLVAIEHSEGAALRFRHDADELSATTERVRTKIRRDRNGLPVAIVTEIDGLSLTLDFAHDAEGRITGWRLPEGTPLALERLGPERMRLRAGAQIYLSVDGEEADGSTRLDFTTGARAEEWLDVAARRPLRLLHRDAAGEAAIDLPFSDAANGRLARAGRRRFRYDRAGRLTACLDGDGAHRWRYDASGRRVLSDSPTGRRLLAYGEGPLVAAIEEGTGERRAFAYDALGRRVTRRGADGTTLYAYSGYGQLAAVIRPDGRTIRYVYDGFGRLVAREAPEGRRYYLCDLDGSRLAEFDGAGRIVATWLWLGGRCLGRIDGPPGAPLAASFHHGPGGRIEAVGDAAGGLTPRGGADPFGDGWMIHDREPGFAGLFGDPDTGLWHAGSRWYDPASAQFLTPDSWTGTRALDLLRRGPRRLTDRLPGGTGRRLEARAAYDWCGHDPVNFTDPTGHNWLGLIWSFLSSFLWEWQLTTLSLQMEAINIVWEVLQLLVLRPAWDTDGYWQTSLFNTNWPMASYRQMVAWALPLNGLLRMHDRGWTLGNVIWVRGDKWRNVAATSKRDLLIAANASDYLAAAEVAADLFRTRNPNTDLTGAANAAGDRVSGVAVAAPAGAALGDVLRNGNWVAVTLQAGGGPEGVSAARLAGGDLLLSTPLPAALRGQPVRLRRLDRAILHLAKDDVQAARSITFIRGQAIHYAAQMPEGFPESGLTASEFLPAARPQRDSLTPRADAAHLLRLAEAGQRGRFPVGQVLRVRHGESHSARQVRRHRGSRDLVLDLPLPSLPAGQTYRGLDLVALGAPSANAAGQNASGDRVEAGRITAFHRLDGVAVTSGAAVERRIVTGLHLRCAIAALPAALHGTALAAARMAPDGAARAIGTVAAGAITTTAAEAKRFGANQPLRLVADGGATAFRHVGAGGGSGTSIPLDNALPAADFPDGSRVTATRLVAERQFETEPSAAPGERITVAVSDLSDLRAGQILRLRAAGATSGGELREIAADPLVVLALDSALPASHAAGLTVERLEPVAASATSGAAAPRVQLFFDLSHPPPYGAGDMVHVSDNRREELLRVEAVSGNSIEATDPIEDLLPTGMLSSVLVTASGKTSANARLDEARVMIPARMDEEPLTRREAFEFHEMRHVWQGAVWGPFLLSLPIPWLINLGFSFTSEAHDANRWIRHFSLGGLDSLFAVIAWGIAGHPDEVTQSAEIVDAERRVLALAADTAPERVAAYSEGAPISILKEDDRLLNYVETLDSAQKRITLRFPLPEDRFAVNSVVKVAVSPFEKIRKTVSNFVGLNLHELWIEHIPQNWARGLLNILNREAWFPGLGLYPLSLIVAGGNEDRLPNEQDAAWHSGDLYTNIAVAQRNEIHVGQFARIFGFLHQRGAGDVVRGLSDEGAAGFLTAEMPAGLAVAPDQAVRGAIDTGLGSVRFHQDWLIPMEEKVENAVGAFFLPLEAGDYTLRVRGDLDTEIRGTGTVDAAGTQMTNAAITLPGANPPPDRILQIGAKLRLSRAGSDEHHEAEIANIAGTAVTFAATVPAGFRGQAVDFLRPRLELVFKFAFDVDFHARKIVHVRPLGVTPDPAQPLFETEEVTYRVAGDAAAIYRLRYRGTPPADAHDRLIGDRVYRAPILPGGAPRTDTLEITATYDPGQAIFRGAGQSAPARLPADAYTNACQRLDIRTEPLTAPAVAAVVAGQRATFQTPIAPREARVTSALPAGAVVNARVLIAPGRPAQLTFVAPDRINAATPITVDLVFGRPGQEKIVPLSVQVTPAP